MILHALKNPISVGAVASASSHLVSGMVAQVGRPHEVVVELGAGTGVITNALSKSENNRRKVISIEIDEQLAEIAKENLPANVDVIVGDAIKLKSFFGVDQVDCIVCSLPLTFFSERDLDQLLSAARSVIKTGGVFVFYLYWMGIWLHRYNKVIEKAESYFSRVDEDDTVWRNLPPARVIVCR